MQLTNSHAYTTTEASRCHFKKFNLRLIESPILITPHQAFRMVGLYTCTIIPQLPQWFILLHQSICFHYFTTQCCILDVQYLYVQYCTKSCTTLGIGRLHHLSFTCRLAPFTECLHLCTYMYRGVLENTHRWLKALCHAISTDCLLIEAALALVVDEY